MSHEEQNEKELPKEEKELQPEPSADAKTEKKEGEENNPVKAEPGESDAPVTAKPGLPPKSSVPRAPRAAGAGKARPAAGARPRPAAKKAEKKPEEPSPLQPQLDRFLRLLKDRLGEGAVKEAYINRAGSHIPTLVVDKEHWLSLAQLLKEEESFQFDYLRLLSGVDYETHMEVVYQFYSFAHGHQIAVRVKTGRDEAKVPSVSHLWKAADWNEREAYDLLGIHFENHPNLRRILMPDDWVGHPLRKDYEPLDKEV
ncbi:MULTISPECIES: NADH-quinone oxidoreductase subunit C [unclassified Thermoactinomyces]|jgi:NADH-quinone oxidoreductase subunit C|uniref:NADH-quinone oxidoreductase subunit C n=1 Tax=unclassified Thermoactinomyces TaxID=2634588 RepID=UPI0018DE2E0B|nr:MULTISPECIES: NADH-quinone oxidoreductase subunit C [unclassified Thermoactinomyces]MBH8597828.1 NADH-quinone oxidoreductase subunit C [Thermoactinomyces sp. CICC 10523]MBH8604179.1 NADH-quinone oxidoreductase subunit C [Thermoactinomyces sp. CICC 10522]